MRTIILVLLLLAETVQASEFYKLKKGMTQDEVYKLIGAPTSETKLADYCKTKDARGFMWTYVQTSGRVKEINVVFCNKTVDMVEHIQR